MANAPNAGCIELVQPVGVSIGMPFKDCIRKNWFDWMVEHPEHPVMTHTSWEHAATSVANAWRDSDPNIIKNGW